MGPVIGITCQYNEESAQVLLGGAYLRAIEAAGGWPLILFPLGEAGMVTFYAGLIDGLLLSGGPDIDPVHFGEEPRGTRVISPLRDFLELALLAEIKQAGKPILAICRGVQVLNVFGGGDLYQDLPTQYPKALKHMQEAPDHYPTHRVDLVAGSNLALLFDGTSLRVNSFHHQAIRSLAPGFRAAAWSEDGLIEAIEGTDPGFIVGVQWHPEMMWEKDEGQARLFSAFVAACRSRSCSEMPLVR